MACDVEKLTYAEKVRLLMAENYWGNNSLGGRISLGSLSVRADALADVEYRPRARNGQLSRV